MSSPTISIYDLMSPVPTDQMRSTFVNTLVSLGVPADKWLKGSVFSTIITVLATVASGFSVILSNGIASMFLDYSSGAWLILLAYYVYGVTAQPATFATGQYSFVNGGGGSFTLPARTLQLVNSVKKTTYTNVADFTLSPTSSLTIDITATVSGAASTAAPGGIDTIVTVMPSVTGTNAAAVVGLDAESDPALRARCQAARALSSNGGPRLAYTAAVKGAINASGNPVNINRVSVSNSSSTGIVTVTVAAPAGAVSTEDLTAASLAIESLVRPNTVTVYLVNATAVNYSNALTVYAQGLPGITAQSIQQAVETDLTAWMAEYPIGGLATTGGNGVFASGINSVVGEANPAIYAVTGATDLAMTTSQVIDNMTTVTVVLVAP